MCFYTWNNKQDGDHFVSKKLDRVLSNFQWMQKFPITVVEFIEGGISDHSHAVIFIEQYISFGPKPFKFFSFWADHKSFF